MSLTIKGITVKNELAIRQYSAPSPVYKDTDQIYSTVEGFGHAMAASGTLSKVVVGGTTADETTGIPVQVITASLYRSTAPAVKNEMLFNSGGGAGSMSDVVIKTVTSPSITIFDLQSYAGGNQLLYMKLDKNITSTPTLISNIKVVSKMSGYYDQVIMDEAVTSGMLAAAGPSATDITVPISPIWAPMAYVNGEFSTGNYIPVEITLTLSPVYYTYPFVKVISVVNNTLTKPMININNPESNTSFGYCLAMNDSGTRIFSGIPLSNGVADAVPESGRVYVHNLIGQNWIPYNTYVQSQIGPLAGSHFGRSVACSNDGLLMIVGEPLRGTDGVVHFFKDNGSAFISAALWAPNLGGAKARFGHYISMNSDGSRVAISAPNFPGGPRIYMYENNTLPSNAWVLTDTLSFSDTHVGQPYSFNIADDGATMVVASSRLYLYTRQIGGTWTRIELESPSSPTFSNVTTRFESCAISTDNSTIVASAEHYYNTYNRYLLPSGISPILNNTLSTIMVPQTALSVTSRNLGGSETRTVGYLSQSSAADGSFSGPGGTQSPIIAGTIQPSGQGTPYTDYCVDIFNNIKTDTDNNIDYAATIDIKFNSAKLPNNLIEKVEIRGAFGNKNTSAIPKFDSSTYTIEPSKTLVMVTPFCTDGSVSFNGDFGSYPVISTTFEHEYIATAASYPRGGTTYRWKFDTVTGGSADRLVNLFIPGNTYYVKIYFSTLKQGKDYVYKFKNGSWKIVNEDDSNQYSGTVNAYGKSLVVSNDGGSIVSSDSSNKRCYLVSSNNMAPMTTVTRMIGDGNESRKFSLANKNDLLLTWTGKYSGDAIAFYKPYIDSPYTINNNNLMFGSSSSAVHTMSYVKMNDYEVSIPYPDAKLSGTQYAYGGNGTLAETVMVSIAGNPSRGSDFVNYTGTLNTLGYSLINVSTAQYVPDEETGRRVVYLDSLNTVPQTQNCYFDDNTIYGSNKIRKVTCGPYAAYSYANCVTLEVYGNLTATPSLPLSMRIITSGSTIGSMTTATRTSANPSQKILRSDAYGSYTELVYDISTFSGSGYIVFPYSGIVQFDFFGTKTNNITSATVAHSLGAVPTFYMIRPKITAPWFIWHKDMPANTYSSDSVNAFISGTVTPPTSTNITTQNTFMENTQYENNAVLAFTNTAYVYAGSYTGNGGANVLNLGGVFNPTLILIKNKNGSCPWVALYVEDMDTTSSKTYRKDLVANTIPYAANSFGYNTITISEADQYVNALGNTYIFVVFSGDK